MDGTFLDDQKQFNKSRFTQQLSALKKRDIKFVVASGNQYYTLRRYFTDFSLEEIAYVAENGAYVSMHGQALLVAFLTEEEVHKTYALLQEMPNIPIMVCGEKSAYMLQSTLDDKTQVFAPHYERLQKISAYQDIEDKILKIALWVGEDKVKACINKIQPKVAGFLTPVSSGNGFIDLIIPGIHKAYGIKKLQEEWHITDAQVAAFGDSDNDIEMLKHAGRSYAMQNAPDRVKQVAKYTIKSNNEQAVLDIIDEILKE